MAGRGQRLSLYEDTLKRVLEDAREQGATGLDFEAVDAAVIERAKKVVRWTEEEGGGRS